MNEQRLQGYFNLIQRLLSCPNGKEPEILSANYDLLDVGLLQAMETVVKVFSQRESEKAANSANRLRNLSTQIAQAMKIPQTPQTQGETENLDAYLEFLQQLLLAIAKNKDDLQVIYALLAKNTDKLNGVFAKILRQSGINALREAKADKTTYHGAELFLVLGNRISKFPLGNKASNMEIAITAYEVVLTFYTQQAFPLDWAHTQNNLGEAYRNRILGDKAENLERAVACYQQALNVATFEAFPYKWAQMQNNLAIAYISRIRGDKAENLERAITCCQLALNVRTIEAFPQDWAQTQNNLGEAYRNRILGNKAENLDRAIACYQEALKVTTFEAFPYEWAGTKNNLAIAYWNRIRGDKAENLEWAIAYNQEALNVRTIEAFPLDWAETQNNLASAYFNRILGDKADNLERAIACYQEALKVITFEAFSRHWAQAQNNLGSVYANRILGDKAENLERAIACYQKALNVRTIEAFPYEWAETQNNLANAYWNRILGDKADNLERAIACYQQALNVRTIEDFPQDWAQTQNNLASVYWNRILGDKAENLERAIACFASAIATVESLREEIVSGQESKRKQAEKWNILYSSMVGVCLELNKTTEAIEYVERSKTRYLVELILERDYQTIFSPKDATQLETYKRKIATGQAQIQNGKAEDPKVLAQNLQQLRQQRNELQDHYLPVGYGFKFDSFQATLDERTAMIEWYLLKEKILAFIIKPTGEVTVWQSQPEDREALYDWVNKYLPNYYNKNDQWRNNLGVELKKLASILHIEEILKQIPKHCDQLILIPHRFLHLLPLHALPVSQNSENSRCLVDLFPRGVSYAPSCQILQQVQKRQRPNFQSLFAIQNPTQDLSYTDLEVEVIQSYFNTSNVLKKTAATLTAINNTDLNTYHCTHFSCHGYFNLTNPSKSALILANAPVADAPTKPDSERYLNLRLGETHDLDKCLTLEKIFDLKLGKCRLVTLSACETGLIDYSNTSDEYIGLPSGFLLAGSSSVVSSLWKVNDLSTSFLMIKFYENLFKLDNLEAGNIAIALKEAQTWLRNLTTERLDRFLEEYKPQIEKVLAQLRKGQRIIFKESLKRIKERQPLPFANPYYWAGFTASGR